LPARAIGKAPLCWTLAGRGLRGINRRRYPKKYPLPLTTNLYMGTARKPEAAK